MVGKEGEMRDLKETVGKKDKMNLERACEGGVWITILPTPRIGLNY